MSDGDKRFFTVWSPNDDNRLVEVGEAAGFTVWGIGDEKAGGVVGYVNTDLADEVVNALNGEPVDEAAEKATDCFVDEFTKEVEEIRAEREGGDDLARSDERENDLLARCVEVIAKGVAHPHAVAAAALGYMVEGDEAK